MNTNLIVESSAVQASRHVVAPTRAGFQGRAVPAAGQVIGDLGRMAGGFPTGLPTWRKRPQTDLYIRLRAPQV